MGMCSIFVGFYTLLYIEVNDGKQRQNAYIVKGLSISGGGGGGHRAIALSRYMHAARRRRRESWVKSQ